MTLTPEQLAVIELDHPNPDTVARDLLVHQLAWTIREAWAENVILRKLATDNDDMLTRQEAQIEALTKELPSDEEIGQEALIIFPRREIESEDDQRIAVNTGLVREGWEEGARWMRERLKEGKQ
jgi:hypothetical protein